MYDATLMVPGVMNFDRELRRGMATGRSRAPSRPDCPQHETCRNKTYAAAHFQSGGKGVHGPGYYLHLEPGECFFGGGMWMPEPKVLEKIRNRIGDKPAEWKRARVNLSHPEDALKRPPRGFDPDHPMIEDIKRKSFTTGVKITNKQVLADDFMKTFIGACREIAPLMKFLATAADVSW